MRCHVTFALSAAVLALTLTTAVEAQPIPGVPERYGGAPAGADPDDILLTSPQVQDLTLPFPDAQDAAELPANGQPANGLRLVPADAANATAAATPQEQVLPATPAQALPDEPALPPEPRLQTVNERPRPELEQLGIRLGSFILTTDTETGAEFTSNVFGDSEDAQSDVLYVIRPNVELRSDWNVHEVGLRFSGEYGSYAENPSENPIETELEASGRLDVTRATALGLRATFATEQESRGDQNVSDTASEPTRSRSYGIEGDASHTFNRLTLALRGSAEVEDFDDSGDAVTGIDNNDDRDATTTGAGLRSTYEVSPATQLFVDAQLNWQRFDQVIDDNGFARDADLRRFTGGVIFEPTPVIRAEIAVGHVHVDLADLRLSSVDAVTVDADIFWSPTPLTTVSASLDTEVDDTTLVGASAEVSRSVGARIDHELLRNLVIGGGGSFERTEFRGITLEEDTILADVGAEYWLSRSLAIVARYEHETQTTNDDQGAVVENVVTVGLRLRH